jgi:F-type H+-transporting ATPase subunit delta
MYSKISRRYSKALYKASEVQNKVKEVAQDSENILNLLKSSKDLSLFFASPIIRMDKKEMVVEDLFKGKISDLTYNFVKLLIKRNREELISYIFEDFLELKNEKEGVIDVAIKTVVKLNKNEESKFKKKIDDYTNLICVPSFQLDEDLIGGFTLQIKDTILDASIQRQLQLLKNKFKETETVI